MYARIAVRGGKGIKKLPPGGVEKKETQDIRSLEERIGHSFASHDLLIQALTHMSAPASQRAKTYQRLEFLGDRVLGLAVSEMLYLNFPEAEEGELSRRLAALVRKESCAEVAQAWGVEPFVRIGDSERQSGTAAKALLGDICESIIGAIFLDAGYAKACEAVRTAFEPRMLFPTRPLRDAKSVLQEWAQGRGLPAPVYAEISRSGPDHAPEFTIGVKVEGFSEARSGGPSKRFAEQAAAEAFLVREKIKDKEL
jgi:ribonuclease-3